MGDDDDEEEEEESDDNSDSSSDQETSLSQIETDRIENTNSIKRRVSFKDEKKEFDESDKTIEDTIHISFKHSDTPSSVPPTLEAGISSPADIYTQYMKEKLPKSILKQSSSLGQVFTEGSIGPNNFQETTMSETLIIKAVGEEVVERTNSDSAVVTSERPVSRFKAVRTASKR